MTLYRKIQKVTFDSGEEILPGYGEFLLFDGTHLMAIKEEEMSVKYIDTGEKEFEFILSHDKVKHPINVEPDETTSWLDDDECEEEEDDELEELFESVSEYFSNETYDQDLPNDIKKKVSIESADGGKFLIFFGYDVKRKKIVPFLEIQDKSRKVKKTVFKAYLNKTNIRKIVNTVTGLKKVLNKELTTIEETKVPVKQKETA